MKLNIRIENGSACIYDWTDDCNELLLTALQLLPHQILSKRYQTSQLRGFNYAKFFKANGIEVDIQIENPSEHARFTVWSQKLRTLRSEISDEEVFEFFRYLKIDFRDVQIRGLKRILKCHFALLSAGCGAGKTLLNLSAAQFKKNKAEKVLVFVVAPSACAAEYIKELERFRGYFDLTMIDMCGLSSAEAKSQIKCADADIFIVSVDSIKQLSSTIQQKLSNFNGETLLIVEEGHSVKNVSSNRSKGVQEIAPLFDQVIVSTATPLPLGAKDLRGYIALVGLPQPEEAYTSGIPSHDYRLLEGVAFITDENDVPFAPLETSNIEYSDLEDLNNKIYDAVMEELEQNRKVVIFTSTNKALEAAYNLFNGIPRTVLSGSFYVEDIKSDGLQDGRKKDFQKKAINQFNNDPECRILIANYKVGSTGLNLQYSGARMAIYYEITNSGADLFQSKYRIRRPNVFPVGGFKYVYALPTDTRQRRTVNRQLLKLADQQTTLRDLKQRIGRSL